MVQNRYFVNGSGQPARSSRRSRFAAAQADTLLGSRIIRMTDVSRQASRRLMIGVILVVALLAFEVFNFDTTRYALRDLLGGVHFLSLEWATILAIAFCAIDFAGLVRVFTADREQPMPKEVWYLMGAWLLGATMNAMMTWWAITLALLNHDFGNEVLSRQQLLTIVPIFVAVLVWLTRILFIGAFTMAGDKILDWGGDPEVTAEQPAPFRAASRRQDDGRRRGAADLLVPVSDELPGFLRGRQAEPPAPAPVAETRRTRPEAPPVLEPVNAAPKPVNEPKRENSNGRVRQRPPVPNLGSRMVSNGAQARGRNR